MLKNEAEFLPPKDFNIKTPCEIKKQVTGPFYKES